MDSRVCHPYNEDVTDKTVNIPWFVKLSATVPFEKPRA